MENKENEIEEFNNNEIDLETKLKEAENKYMLLYADFENYKKRVIKEKEELRKLELQQQDIMKSPSESKADETNDNNSPSEISSPSNGNGIPL